VNAGALECLRHVSGVLGSFTCAATGQLLATDMPASYSRAVLESTSARLGNLLQTLDEALPQGRSSRLAFHEHQLLVQRFSLGLLCVLTRRDCDQRALRVTARLVVRQLLAP
jgi:hypothetical protein